MDHGKATTDGELEFKVSKLESGPWDVLHVERGSMNLCDLKRTVGYEGQERKAFDDYNEEKGKQTGQQNGRIKIMLYDDFHRR